MKKLLTLLGVIAALALIAGCGDDGGGGDGGGSDLSKDDYISAVRDAAQPIAETADEGQALTQATDAEEVSSLLTEVIGTYDTAIKDLEDVDPPSDIADTHDQLIETLTTLRDLYAQIKEQADAGDIDSIPPDFQVDLTQALADFASIGQEFSDNGYDLSGGNGD
jgi:hypothetical protein